MDKEDKNTPRTGSCLCGAVAYEISGPLRDVVTCHCTQCRKTSGHYVAATAARHKHFRFTEDRGLKWYDSSTTLRRGFCGECGASLFFQAHDKDWISIAAGTLDGVSGLKVSAQIFASEKSDYYDINGNAPQYAQSGHSVTIPE